MTARRTDPYRNLADAADDGANYVFLFVRWTFSANGDDSRCVVQIAIMFVGFFVDELADLSSFLVTLRRI